MRAAGAEALQENLIERAEDEGWTRFEWYLNVICGDLLLTPQSSGGSYI